MLLYHLGRITVVDARADTSSLGLMQKKVIDPFLGALNNSTKNQAEQRTNKTPTFLKLNNGLRNESELYVNQYLHAAANNTLPGVLMVIKKLWLSDELNMAGKPPGNDGMNPKTQDQWNSGVAVRIEFYLQDKWAYYPLYRYDSVISKALTISEYGADYVALALCRSLRRLAEMDNKTGLVMQRHVFSLPEIEQHNDYAIPALKDAFLNPGVYMSFEEFRNNTPSHRDFELKRDRRTDIVYIKQANGNEYVARNVWGYCNGENAFIRSVDNFFLLQRKENAFYIFGAKDVKGPITGGYAPTNDISFYVPSANGSNARFQVQLKPFQVDWDSGQLY